MAQKPPGWKSVTEVERQTRGRPFPATWYQGEFSDGQDHDGYYIAEQLDKLTATQRVKAVAGYDAAYAGVDSRGDVNRRLMGFVERCLVEPEGWLLSR